MFKCKTFSSVDPVQNENYYFLAQSYEKNAFRRRWNNKKDKVKVKKKHKLMFGKSNKTIKSHFLMKNKR